MAFSAAVVLGAVIYLAQHGRSPADYRVFEGEPAVPQRCRGIVRARTGSEWPRHHPAGIVVPDRYSVARVILSIWGFAEERDRMYVAFTVIVLAILIFSLVGAFHS